MIKVTCDGCGKGLAVKESMAGRTGKCPSCGEEIMIPHPTAETEQDETEFDFENYVPRSKKKSPPKSPPAPEPVTPKPSGSLLRSRPMLMVCVATIVAFLIGFIAGREEMKSEFRARLAEAGKLLQEGLKNSFQPPSPSTATSSTPKPAEPTNPVKPSPPPKDEWLDAGDVAKLGDVEVSFAAATVDKVQLEGLRAGRSQDRLLQITLNIRNLSDTKKVQYTSWSGAGNRFNTTTVATIEDNFGNYYKRTSFGISKVAGQIERESIYPEKSITDVLVFEEPIPKAEFLKLELPGLAFSHEGTIRLKIPMTSVK